MIPIRLGEPLPGALPPALAALTALTILAAQGACDARAGSYVEIARVCADSADRVVNGATVSRECWRWERTYVCVEESADRNRCDEENLPDACAVTRPAACDATDSSEAAAGCLEMKTELLCSARPAGPGITALDPLISVAYATRRTPDLPLAEDCVIASRTCLDAAPREIEVSNLPGETVRAAPACWQERLVVACPSAEAAASCARLEAAGCAPASGGERSCEATDASGKCISWRAEYVCRGNGPSTPSIPSGPDLIPGESQEVPDGGVAEDDSACREALGEAAASGLACRLLEESCAEPGETRLIDGREVTLACRRTDRRYACEAEGRNGCAALEALAASGTCSEEADDGSGASDGPGCLETDASGGCVRRRAVFRCAQTSGPQDSAAAGGAARLPDLIEEAVEPVDACRALASEAGCVETASECVEGPGIRMVNGKAIYRDCWMTRRTHVCREPGNAGSAGECAALEADASCRLVSQSCPSGEAECARPTRVYECTQGGSTEALGTVCSGEACIEGVCAPSDDAPDEDFAACVVAMEIAREAGAYGDVSGNRFFSGEVLGCRDRKGASSCCRSEPAPAMTNSAFGLWLSFGTGAGVEAVKFLGSPWVYDILAWSDKTSGLLNALYGGASSGLYEPTFSFWGASLAWTEAGGWSFDFSPAGFALAAGMHFYGRYSACRAEDQRVAMMKGERLCRYVGTTCTNTTPGLGCTEREERYACFNSRLARILNEQGRAQLGRGWGTPEHPDARGFTAEELAELDFSKMDLSEFVADVVRSALEGKTAGVPDEVLAARRARATERINAILRDEAARWSAMPGATGATRTPAAGGEP